MKLIATKAIGQYFFLIKNIIIRFAHKIKFLKEQLWQKENIEKYGLENTNIVNDIFEIILYSNEESLYIILDTLIYLDELSPIYSQYIAQIGSK